MERIRENILSQAGNYGLLTATACSKLYGLGLDDAKEVLGSMVDCEQLGRGELRPGEDYFYLRSELEPLMPGARTGPLRGSKKLACFGTLSFCVLGDVYRPKIPDALFRSDFGELYFPGPIINYATCGARLYYVRVDKPRSGEPERLLAAFQRDCRSRAYRNNLPVVNAVELQERETFAIGFVTAFNTHRKQVRKLIDRESERFRLYSSYLSHDERNEVIPIAAQLEHERWHKKNKRRKPPIKPPTIEVEVADGLFELMYPKPENIGDRDGQQIDEPSGSMEAVKVLNGFEPPCPPRLLNGLEKRLMAFDLQARSQVLAYSSSPETTV